MQILKTIHEWLDIACSSEYFEETREKFVKIGDWVKEMTNKSVEPPQYNKLTQSDVNIHLLEKLKTKGSGKRMKGGREKAIEKAKNIEKRLCCGSMQ